MILTHRPLELVVVDTKNKKQHKINFIVRYTQLNIKQQKQFQNSTHRPQSTNFESEIVTESMDLLVINN